MQENQTEIENIKNWRVDDNHVSTELNLIYPYSERANSIYSRNKNNPLIKDGFLRISGAIEMMRGLEYHFENIKLLHNSLEKCKFPRIMQINKKQVENIQHEFISYINRVGQFCYFIKSKYVITRIKFKDNQINILLKCRAFRHKHSAHRSIDKPLKKDTVNDCVNNAMLHNGGSLKLNKYGNVLFDIHSEGKYYSIDILAEHESIMKECYFVIESLVCVKNLEKFIKSRSNL